MNLIRHPEGDRLARMEYDRDGFPTGRMFLTEYTLQDVTQTNVFILYRKDNDFYVRVKVIAPVEEPMPYSLVGAARRASPSIRNTDI